MAYTLSELPASRHAAHESLNSEYFIMFWARFLVYMDQENVYMGYIGICGPKGMVFFSRFGHK